MSSAIPDIAARAPGTSSTDASVKPTVMAKLHLEDGSTFTGYSFGAHVSVEGEVSL